MTFKRRLIIAFSIVLILPLILCTVSFFVIGNYMSQSDDAPVTLHNYNELTGTLQTDAQLTDELYKEIYDTIQKEPARLEDKTYLSRISDGLKEKTSFIIVRKDGELFYTGNEQAALRMFSELPPYAGEKNNDPDGYGYYMDNLNRILKQLDFTFSDGSEGSFFIVTRVVNLMSGKFLISMFIAMIAILAATAFFLTNWMKAGVIQPINQLNTAMRNIRDGNLTYMLPTAG